MANYFTICGYREQKKQDARAGSSYLVFLTDSYKKINLYTLLLELTPTLPRYSLVIEDSYQDYQTVEIHSCIFPEQVQLDYSNTPILIWDATACELINTNHKEMIDTCSRAEQSFMDCTTCVRLQSNSTNATTANCILHVLIPQRTTFGFNPKHYENRKIAGFDWVNPKWSAPENSCDFPAYYRPLKDHEFTEVAVRKEVLQQRAKQAAQTRTRGISREKTMCSKCSVHIGCATNRTSREFNSCNYYYPETIEKDILSTTTTKLTIPQLSYILWFSGLVPFRIDNRKQWLTLCTIKGELTPTLQQVRPPYNYYNCGRQVLTWDETYAIMSKIKKQSQYRGTYDLTDVPQVSKNKLALLFEACAISWSPTYRTPWRKTEYKTAYVSYGPRDAIIINFSWPNMRQGRWELPWTLDLEKISDIYQYYRKFNYAQPIAGDLK